MSQRRARKGGEQGANGEFYEGGKFIATTDHAKETTQHRKSMGKTLVEPGTLAVPPETGDTEYAVAIFAGLQGIEQFDSRKGAFQINPRLVPGYFGALEERQANINRYNQGARWRVFDRTTRQPTGRYLDKEGNDWNAK
jgi:hypothetical protein